MTVGDIAVVDGTATITSQAGTWSIRPADDGLPSHRVLAQQLKDAVPVTIDLPHLCRSGREISALALDVPLLPPIDQWGYVPFPLHRLTPHSLSRLVRQMLAGDFGTHRHIPVDDEVTEPEELAPVPVEARRVYSRDDAQQAWARRRADLADLAGIDTVLDEVDARAKELQQRTAAVLATENTP